MVLVDTSVWSLALRRHANDLSARDQRLVEALMDLITDGKAVLIGMIRQEILSGIRDPKAFRVLRARLIDLPYLPVGLTEHDLAASFYNKCATNGIVASAVDMLICAAGVSHRMPIFTTDTDFNRYTKYLPLKLLKHP
ncbi:MAG: PIN domain-containing protein [Gammaproteobacteria bacterium]|nr:PIN domain-containing protein [Gammaproteobacteria bacterium]